MDIRSEMVLQCKGSKLSLFIPCSLLFALNSIIFVVPVLIERLFLDVCAIKQASVLSNFHIASGRAKTCASFEASQPLAEGESKQSCDSSVQGHHEADCAKTMRINAEVAAGQGVNRDNSKLTEADDTLGYAGKHKGCVGKNSPDTSATDYMKEGRHLVLVVCNSSIYI